MGRGSIQVNARSRLDVLIYLDTNEWQVAGITTALSSLDRGMSMAHSRVSEWVTSWETCRERPAPKRV
jgi:predicted transcriptional regulator